MNRSKRGIAEIEAKLYEIDPDCDYETWFKALKAIYYETDGSEEGFELADAWSSGGRRKYKGTRDVMRQWRNSKPRNRNPITFGTLSYLAKNS